MTAPLPPPGGAHPVSSPVAHQAPPLPPAPPGEYVAPPTADVGDVSLGDLVGQVARDLSTLIRQELALAKAEVRQEAGKAAKGAGAFGGAGVAAFFVLMFLSIALWAGLSNAMDSGWAGLIVALVWAVIGAVLFVVGRSNLRRVNPTPERTVDTLSTVPDALKGNRGGAA